MNGLIWVLMAGVAGWLTGKIVGQEGYAKALDGYVTKGLDIVFGIMGASIGGYLFFWAVIGEGSSFSRYGTAILGSITLVGVVRLVSARYSPSSLR
ncbi:GlsB/YeaQ/YmgE family stress response membrane protein [bacterium]|nr:MAG: GlsB/YeaQ/YmgE family stress response membrane protein [bacterium]